MIATEKILKPYKKIIQASLYPAYGKPISLSTGKSAIRAYKATTKDAHGELELMMFYVECGNNFTVDFGDIDEPFYNSVEGLFEKVVDRLKKADEKKKAHYLPRLKAVVESARGIGWGYYDHISEYLRQAFPDL